MAHGLQLETTTCTTYEVVSVSTWNSPVSPHIAFPTSSWPKKRMQGPTEDNSCKNIPKGRLSVSQDILYVLKQLSLPKSEDTSPGIKG